jgi:phosphatidate cytidylyltransferase
MLRTRVLTSFIAIPIVIAGVFAGGLWFLAGVALFALVAGWEFGRMMRVGGYATTPAFTLGLIALLLLNSYRSDLSLECILTLTLLFSLTWQLFQAGSTSPTADWALTVVGGLYIGWGMAHLVALRQLADGVAWVWLVLLCTWGADTFAYLVGSRWGRHKLWPRLSPKKSWEGFAGSILGSLLGAAVVVFLSNLGWVTCLLIALVIPIISLFGDVSISMMKRDVGVKDSSNLFPGHGGFLDRIDSLLFVSIVVYYYAIWHNVLGSTLLGYFLSGVEF